MKLDLNPAQLIDPLRAWFHPKDRHLYLSDSQRIIGQRIVWEKAISKYLLLPGLVGFWPMTSIQRSTGQAYDLSGQARHLTYNGNPQYNLNNQIVPYLNFDGSGDFLSRADETDLDISGSETIYAAGVRGLTLGGWFWLDAVAGSRRSLITKDSGVATVNRSYSLYVDTGGEAVFECSSIGTAMDGGTYNAVNFINPKTWYFIVGKFAPSSIVKVYVNDADGIDNAITHPASLFNGNAALQIGATSGTLLLTGRAALCFLCANALPDTLISMLYQHTRQLFNGGV